MSWGVLGEPLRERLDPPECYKCEDDDCPDCETARDRAIEHYLDCLKDEGEL